MIPGMRAYHVVNRGIQACGEGILGPSLSIVTSKCKASNAAQVFNSSGALEHTLVLGSDLGFEFGSSKQGFAEALRKRLLDEGLIQNGEKFVHRFNLASAPTQSSHIERLWSTLRTKLKLAATANFGGIDRKAAKDARRETYTKKDEAAGRGAYGQSKGTDGWTAWVRKATDAINTEQTVGTDLSPDQYLRTFVTKGKAALERTTASGEDAELDKKGEQQQHAHGGSRWKQQRPKITLRGVH